MLAVLRSPEDRKRKLRAHEKQVRELKRAKDAEHAASSQRDKRRQQHQASLLPVGREEGEEAALHAPQAELDGVRASEEGIRKPEREPPQFQQVLFPTTVKFQKCQL